MAVTSSGGAGPIWNTADWQLRRLRVPVLFDPRGGVEVEGPSSGPPGVREVCRGGGGGGRGFRGRGRGRGVEGGRGQLVLMVQVLVLLGNRGMDLQLVLQNLGLYQSLHMRDDSHKDVQCSAMQIR